MCWVWLGRYAGLGLGGKGSYANNISKFLNASVDLEISKSILKPGAKIGNGFPKKQQLFANWEMQVWIWKSTKTFGNLRKNWEMD